MKMNIDEVLNKIQTELVATKDKFNNFGKYKYRSCESILENLKPLLAKYEASIILNDEITEVGGRVYVKATATLRAKEGEVSASAYAREADSKKGMDSSQLTGATSSYARKYALGGLLAIDDSADADSLNNNAGYTQQQQPQNPPQQVAPRQLDAAGFEQAKAYVTSGKFDKNRLLDPSQFALTEEQKSEVMQW